MRYGSTRDARAGAPRKGHRGPFSLVVTAALVGPRRSGVLSRLRSGERLREGERMGILKDISTVYRTISAVRAARKLGGDNLMSMGSLMEDNAARHADGAAVVTDLGTTSWGELNAMSNRVADALSKSGVGHGDCVGLFMHNRVEFLASLTGIVKLGAVASLLNNNLEGPPLVHCMKVTEGKRFIFGAEVGDALDGVREELSLTPADCLYVPDGDEDSCPAWAQRLDVHDAALNAENPASTGKVKMGDAAVYLFTSGTTGLPKAAPNRHERFVLGGKAVADLALDLHPGEVVYSTLPLYHGTGLIGGYSSALSAGATLALRRKFSASGFIDDARKFNAKGFIYIGELIRYLMNTEQRPSDADNPLTYCWGNGLRPDIWMDFKRRFGVDVVTEFYGSSEGNIVFINTLNRDRTIGLTGNKIFLAKYDVDEDEILRDDSGRCIPAAVGEPGLCLGLINEDAPFDGYTNEEATNEKILRDVKVPGDRYFNSGDLIKQVDVGFALGIPHYQFVDRVGDTFRWKGENVSTNEVGEHLSGFPGIDFANVYGVEIPGTNGRAGMAAISVPPEQLESGLDMSGLSTHAAGLPPYARPVFLRLLTSVDTTGTMKLKKTTLRTEAFHLDRCSDPLYVMKPGSDGYEPLDESHYQEIVAGTARY